VKKLSFIELARKILTEAGFPMTTEEIWEYAQKNGLDLLVGSKGKTPWATLGARIYVELRDNSKTDFVKIDSKPKKFFLRHLINKAELEQITEFEKEKVEEPSLTRFHERDLHPFLSYFADSYLQVHTKTIYHERSSRKSYAQWLHPDIVGVRFPIEEWEAEVLDFGMALGSSLIKLYSFELKKELTFSNLRESFFQTVSNSSWANEGYLVASKLSKDEEFMNELKRLSSAFGIGIIQLDIEDPDAAEIIFPARFKSDLDWETINKISKENPDFTDFLKRVKNDISSKEVRKEKYDRIFQSEKLIQTIRSKK
jgi:hypothetical protein